MVKTVKYETLREYYPHLDKYKSRKYLEIQQWVQKVFQAYLKGWVAKGWT